MKRNIKRIVKERKVKHRWAPLKTVQDITYNVTITGAASMHRILALDPGQCVTAVAGLKLLEQAAEFYNASEYSTANIRRLIALLEADDKLADAWARQEIEKRGGTLVQE